MPPHSIAGRFRAAAITQNKTAHTDATAKIQISPADINRRRLGTVQFRHHRSAMVDNENGLSLLGAADRRDCGVLPDSGYRRIAGRPSRFNHWQAALAVRNQSAQIAAGRKLPQPTGQFARRAIAHIRILRRHPI